jgi:hypothetical protein
MPEEPTLPGRRVVLAFAFRCCNQQKHASACILRERRVVLAYERELFIGTQFSNPTPQRWSVAAPESFLKAYARTN